MNELGILN